MKELRFDDRVAIVTGAGGGLGREYALLLASRGAKVLVNDYGGGADGKGISPELARSVVWEIERAGGTAVANADSVATVEGGASIVRQAFEKWGRVDIVINNAGITLGGIFHEMPEDFIDMMLATHLRGAFNVTRPAWKVMVEQRYGRIVNTSSDSVFGIMMSSGYAAAKAGLIGLTKALAVEGAAYGIRVNGLMPAGYTRMTEQIPDEKFTGWLRENCRPSFVAPLVAWLVHEEVPCTGEIFACGAGRSARVFFGTASGFHAKEHTPEEIREHFEEVMNPKGYRIIKTSADDMRLFFEIAPFEGERESPFMKAMELPPLKMP